MIDLIDVSLLLIYRSDLITHVSIFQRSLRVEAFINGINVLVTDGFLLP